MASQEKNMNVCEECGRCNRCNHDDWSQHLVLRWCLGLVILFVVLWVGISVGELKGSLENGNGGNWGRMNRGGYSQPMMYDRDVMFDAGY